MDWKEVVQCAVCLRPFDDSHLPVSLICGHTICIPCIITCSGTHSSDLSQEPQSIWPQTSNSSSAPDGYSSGRVPASFGLLNDEVSAENHVKKGNHCVRSYTCPLDQTVHRVPLIQLPVNQSLINLLKLTSSNPHGVYGQHSGFLQKFAMRNHEGSQQSMGINQLLSGNQQGNHFAPLETSAASHGWMGNYDLRSNEMEQEQNEFGNRLEDGIALSAEFRGLKTESLVNGHSSPSHRPRERSLLSASLSNPDIVNRTVPTDSFKDDREAYEAAQANLDLLANTISCGEFISVLNKPLQRKVLALLQCQIALPEGRQKCVRAARSVCERVVMELIVQHQNQQQLTSHLWSAVRARGCQFLGPAMQEEVLKLVLLALETGSALSRKVLVMFIVQKLKPQYSQASKTSVGHVVQLLYRASCFKVSKRDGDSSLMELKEEFRNYEALRKEHDAQIIQIAQEAGLRIAPEQWSALLYGDHMHKSHMQSIIDKLQSAQYFTQSVQELLIAVQRSGDPGNLCRLRGPLDQIGALSTDIPNQAQNQEDKRKEPPSIQLIALTIHSVVQIVTAFLSFMSNVQLKREMMSAARMRSNASDMATGIAGAENAEHHQVSYGVPSRAAPFSHNSSHRALTMTRSLPHTRQLTPSHSLPLFAAPSYPFPAPAAPPQLHIPLSESLPPLSVVDVNHLVYRPMAAHMARPTTGLVPQMPMYHAAQVHGTISVAQNRGAGQMMARSPLADEVNGNRIRMNREQLLQTGSSTLRPISRQASVPVAGLDRYISTHPSDTRNHITKGISDDEHESVSSRCSNLEDDFYSAQLHQPTSLTSSTTRPSDSFPVSRSRPLQASLSSPYAWPSGSYSSDGENDFLYSRNGEDRKMQQMMSGSSTHIGMEMPASGNSSLLSHARKMPSSSGSLLDEFARWRDDASTSQGLHRIPSLSNEMGNMRISRSAVFHDELGHVGSLDSPYSSSFKQPTFKLGLDNTYPADINSTSSTSAPRFHMENLNETDKNYVEPADGAGSWAASCLFSLSDDDH